MQPKQPPVAADPPAEVAEGQRGLISRLFRENNQALLNYLLTQLRNEQEAREVAQEAYVKLLQLDKPEAISFLRTYLFKIAGNLAIDRLRRDGRKARIERSDAAAEWTTGPTVERAVLASQEAALLRQVIAELEPRYQRAFIQHKFGDRSIADIATDLGITSRMTRTYVARAVLYCRLRLDGYKPAEAMTAAREAIP